MTPIPETEARPAPAFQTLCGAAEDGRLLDELNERTRELVSVMRSEQQARGGKPKGALTLAFAFQLDQHGLMEVTANVTVKEPKAERSRSIFYALQDNTLSPNNPKQLTMDLGTPREVASPTMKVI
jgi:hypothetical protein